MRTILVNVNECRRHEFRLTAYTAEQVYKVAVNFVREYKVLFLTVLFLFLFDIKALAASPSGDITIVMAGDVLMHDKVIKSGISPDGSYNYDHLFSNVKNEVAAADIAIINQETILGGEELKFSGYPSFNSPYEVGDAEVKAGFDVILQGTNHALDRSAKGVENCLAYWESAHPGTEVAGIHDSAEDQAKISIVNKNGIRIAILNYTYGTNGIQMPKGKGYLVDYLTEKRVRDDIKKAEAEADFTVVCPHWGTEYSLNVSSEQKKWAGIFRECGADLIIGTHPHVIEPFEIIKENGREIPVYYSIGNFVNATSGRGSGVKNRMVGGIAKIRIGRDAAGSVTVKEAAVRPVICHLTDDTVTAYFMEDYNETLATQNKIREQDPEFSYASCLQLVNTVWPKGVS